MHLVRMESITQLGLGTESIVPVPIQLNGDSITVGLSCGVMAPVQTIIAEPIHSVLMPTFQRIVLPLIV